MKKKLVRVESGKMICGVCNGIAAYFGVDPTVVRLAFVIFACCGGSGLLAYFAAALIIPKESAEPTVE